MGGLSDTLILCVVQPDEIVVCHLSGILKGYKNSSIGDVLVGRLGEENLHSMGLEIPRVRDGAFHREGHGRKFR